MGGGGGEAKQDFGWFLAYTKPRQSEDMKQTTRKEERVSTSKRNPGQTPPAGLVSPALRSPGRFALAAGNATLASASTPAETSGTCARGRKKKSTKVELESIEYRRDETRAGPVGLMK